MDQRLKLGKVPPELLRELLATLPIKDQALIVPPGVGLDAAGISIGQQLIAVATDPVTFKSDRAGAYCVWFNVNDVACLGCRPRWFTVNILLPEHSSVSTLQQIWHDIVIELEKYQVQLVGGHTEVTNLVTDPIITGQIIGQSITGRLLNPGNGNPGDKILLWQPIAIDGTALLARQRYETLLDYFDATELDAMCHLLTQPGICVWPLVERVVPTEGLVSLHDLSDGGIATGLHELAEAARCGVYVDGSAIPILPQTRQLGRLFQFNPLGFLSSGSLLLLCRPSAADCLLSELSHEPLSIIGKLTESKERLIELDGKVQALPRFTQDEIVSALQYVTYFQAVLV